MTPDADGPNCSKWLRPFFLQCARRRPVSPSQFRLQRRKEAGFSRVLNFDPLERLVFNPLNIRISGPCTLRRSWPPSCNNGCEWHPRSRTTIELQPKNRPVYVWPGTWRSSSTFRRIMEGTGEKMIVVRFYSPEQLRNGYENFDLAESRTGQLWLFSTDCGSPGRHGPGLFATPPHPFRLPRARHLPRHLSRCEILRLI